MVRVYNGAVGMGKTLAENAAKDPVYKGLTRTNDRLCPICRAKPDDPCTRVRGSSRGLPIPQIHTARRGAQ